mmetsp:Transcript_3176/g.9878  ORF Transcript_3176/g.9878 Transcript_3176/m.9878 type:complete len:403 (-) Transcript_3176:3591-4799(-)
MAAIMVPKVHIRRVARGDARCDIWPRGVKGERQRRARQVVVASEIGRRAGLDEDLIVALDGRRDAQLEEVVARRVIVGRRRGGRGRRAQQTAAGRCERGRRGAAELRRQPVAQRLRGRQGRHAWDGTDRRGGALVPYRDAPCDASASAQAGQQRARAARRRRRRASRGDGHRRRVVAAQRLAVQQHCDLRARVIEHHTLLELDVHHDGRHARRAVAGGRAAALRAGNVRVRPRFIVDKVQRVAGRIGVLGGVLKGCRGQREVHIALVGHHRGDEGRHGRAAADGRHRAASHQRVLERRLIREQQRVDFLGELHRHIDRALIRHRGHARGADGGGGLRRVENECDAARVVQVAVQRKILGNISRDGHGEVALTRRHHVHDVARVSTGAADADGRAAVDREIAD